MDAIPLVALPPPLFAVRHCEAALQRARGLAQAERSSRERAEQYQRDRDRALFHVRVKDRQ